MGVPVNNDSVRDNPHPSAEDNKIVASAWLYNKDICSVDNLFADKITLPSLLGNKNLTTAGKSVPFSSTGFVCKINWHFFLSFLGKLSKKYFQAKIVSGIDFLLIFLELKNNVNLSLSEPPAIWFWMFLRSSLSLSIGLKMWWFSPWGIYLIILDLPSLPKTISLIFLVCLDIPNKASQEL